MPSVPFSMTDGRDTKTCISLAPNPVEMARKPQLRQSLNRYVGRSHVADYTEARRPLPQVGVDPAHNDVKFRTDRVSYMAWDESLC